MSGVTSLGYRRTLDSYLSSFIGSVEPFFQASAASGIVGCPARFITSLQVSLRLLM